MKPVYRPEQAEQDRLREKMSGVMLEVTQYGAQQMGMTGVSFVVSGLQHWLTELHALDAAETSKFLHALGDFYDPKASDVKRDHAERKRRNAVDKIFAALDLDMTKPEGNA